jgi:predicted dienelactone hydrolase
MVHVRDETADESFPMLVLYPSTAGERPEPIERFVLPVAVEGAPAEGRFPLVVLSHGTGGSHLLYRTLAAHLARRGFVVALPEHPRNNRNDNSLAGTDALLESRPRHLRLAMDWAYGDEALGPRLMPGTVAVVGHSIGGYTALALAGGRPWAGPHEVPDGQPHPIAVTADERVRALVLLAPATPWFDVPEGLRDVRIPILLVTGGQDEHTSAWHAQVLLRGLPPETPVEHHVEPGAGHYSFLSPFPQALTRPEFPPSQDPPGFDRVRFHEELNARVEAFLRRVLLTGSTDPAE